MIANFYINNEKYELNVNGEVIKGNDQILIKNEIDLTENTKWHSQGFIVKKFLGDLQQKNIINQVQEYFIKLIKRTFNKLSNLDLKLEDYHKYLNYNDHLAMLKIIENGISFDDININKEILENAVSEILNVSVSTKNPHSDEINDKTFALRIIRPNCHDFNPPHKDVYLDRLKNGINIYLPIIGSNQNSSLPLMPKSHFLNENQIYRTKNGALINNVKFRVPCIIKTDSGLKLIRPNPKNDEILLFSPYLIHGGGLNLNSNLTRISLELRFWRNT